MPKETSRRRAPLGPLLAQFRSARSRPRAELECAALAGLVDAPDDTLIESLRSFAEQLLPVLFHTDVFARQVRFIRHALAHLVRGHDPLPDRLARCVTPGEPYHVPGLGPGFWSHVVRALDADRLPLWCPAVERGLAALGLFPANLRGPWERFAGAAAGFVRLRDAAPDLTAAELDDFLERVSRMTGRELPPEPDDPAAFAWAVGPGDVRRAVREVRTRTPLRKQLRGAPREVAEKLAEFQAHARAGRYEDALDAFRATGPEPDWEQGLPRLDDAYAAALPPAERARLWCETAAVLREEFRVHPIELAEVVARVSRQAAVPERTGFGGFCSDTFAFLSGLSESNARDWMAANRERYRFAVREPQAELCRAVAERYVRPVLNREYGWDLECDARTGRALTSICKNDFGRGGPYQPVQWVTFYRKSLASRRAAAQFFVRLAPAGVKFGFHLGRTAREAGGQFRRNLQEHGEAVFRALAPGSVLGGCRFWVGEDLSDEVAVRSAADLRAWALHKTIAAGVALAPDDPALRGDDLPGEVLLTFDRLIPLFACAAEADPRPVLARRAGTPGEPAPYHPAAFQRETYLSEVWLDRVLGLLRLKKQLVLQGVPGTGKTHVARCLARLLTHDRPGCVRLVQFHPSYSYEEFVEGIRVRNVVTDGRSEVTYPVEDGVLCEFAARAGARPSEPHVLVVDELNRGNLPRIFGELLFLLEYRDQAVTLPYSKRPFRLPANLFVLATTNPLDRTAVALDQALKRRFSFVDMPADAAVLASWLEHHPPREDGTFGPRVVRLFEELNARLARDLGPGKQVGHSFFMVPGLDVEKLAAVWEHSVRPTLLDYLGGRAEWLAEYTPERLLGDRPRRVRPAAAGGSS
jgi:5-methylcytosine-specific restriction protein B